MCCRFLQWTGLKKYFAKKNKEENSDSEPIENKMKKFPQKVT